MITLSNFCSDMWPEEPTPEDVKDCMGCGLYKQGTRTVWGEGIPDAKVMIILDNPGAREDRKGNPFVCGTRQTLHQTTRDVGLEMSDLYVTFILKRKPVRAYEKEQVRQICMNHLHKQIATKKPSLIVCLGNVAVQSFSQVPDVDVKSLRGSWHDVGGIQTAVAYHPLAIRRRPNLQSLFSEDWKFVANHYHNLKH